ncbi:DsbA family protein [Moritella sp. Urea-trap-13]|uniref:DsbA family protein n=1 Tax=Moritella sp. Urea-trap-13 TaxID=2058327 RepID=UPI000C32E487|nr:DsbA family protein [Moritella sp. Urea-trap-13]PKH05912.1 DsbA family protein [Moritella sp. Urea-trap-13]
MPVLKPKLYYVYDPMCSWCWGYKPVWNQIKQAVTDDVEIIYVLGGLAPDTDEPMPEMMQAQIASHWKKIENFLGSKFNYEFWTDNTPRRATYPACRAIVAARAQDAEQAMLDAIQVAYYTQAKNPSDNSVLVALAKNIGLDIPQFETDLLALKTHQALLTEIRFARSIGGSSFPSLFVVREGKQVEIPVDYKDAEVTIELIRSVI